MTLHLMYQVQQLLHQKPRDERDIQSSLATQQKVMQIKISGTPPAPPADLPFLQGNRPSLGN